MRGNLFRWICVASGLLSGFSFSAIGEDQPTEANQAYGDNVTWLINALCDCAGFYRAGIALYEGKPASAENLRGLARGAELAAKYLLAHEYATKHDKPRAYGAFSDYTEGRVETSRTRVLALIENTDEEGFNIELQKCSALAKMQEEIVQKMRDDAVGR